MRTSLALQSRTRVQKAALTSVLFLSEAVTLAHAVRPMVLARAVHQAGYDVCVAWDGRYRSLFPKLPFREANLRSMSTERFLHALAYGRPIYDVDTLYQYVEDDVSAIRAVNPAIVIGDFRLTLPISAALTGIPCMTVTNAYWSPYASQKFPVPAVPMSRLIGIKTAQRVFDLIRPLAFAYHALPMNRVRTTYGLAKLPWDLRHVYTSADHVLYADVPELVPTDGAPGNHYYLGPILWSPDTSLPRWWQEIPNDKPVIYVTLGSSGNPDTLRRVLEALADMPVFVLAATAGRLGPCVPVPRNARTADFLPGERASARADLVICNGGSPTTQQALAAGTPILGIAGNMDQMLNMQSIARVGAGIFLRDIAATDSDIRTSLTTLLKDQNYRKAAKEVAGVFARYRATERFLSLIDNLTGR